MIRTGRVVVIVLFAGALALPSSLCADDPYGRFPEPVTLRIGFRLAPDGQFPVGDSPSNNIYTRHLEKTINVLVRNEWVAQDKDYFTRVDRAIALGEIPDAMIVNDSQLRRMVAAGQLQDLTQVFARHASTQLRTAWSQARDTAEKAANFGGRMMAIPSITVPEDGYTLLWIRQDWLKKLGLRAPRSMSDLETVLKAFIEKDPGGVGTENVIGIGGPQSGAPLYGDFLVRQTNNAFTFDPIFSAFGATPGYWVKAKDGRASYGSIQPETKVALAKLAELYRKGLLDPYMGIRKDATEAIVSGQVGVFFGPWWMGYWPLPEAVKNNPKADWQAYAAPLNSVGQWTPHTGSMHKEFLVVRKGYEHPDAVVKILNILDRDQHLFDVKNTMIQNYPLRVVITMPDDLVTSRQAALDVLFGRREPSYFDSPSYAPYTLLQQDIESLRAVKKPPFDDFGVEFWDTASVLWPRSYSVIVGAGAIAQAGRPRGNQIPFYSATPTMASRWSSLRRLEDDYFYAIILGGRPVSDFENFVREWRSQGGDLVTAEVNDLLADLK